MCRLLQGLALGGEYGGAATYVAEHAPHGRRGFYTSWIQTTATVGLFLSLLVILALRLNMSAEAFARLGLARPVPPVDHPPRLLDLDPAAIAGIARLPEDEGGGHPLEGAFDRSVRALGQRQDRDHRAVRWHGGPGRRLVLRSVLRAVLPHPDAEDRRHDRELAIAFALLAGTPFFVFFGWLSDKIGRKPILLFGCFIAAVTYFTLFHMIAEVGNPKLIAATENVKITLTADPSQCGTLFDPVGVRVFTRPCDVVRRTLATNSMHYGLTEGAAGSPLTASINGTDVPIADATGAGLVAAAQAAGYPKAGDETILKQPSVGGVLSDSRSLTLIGLLFILVLYVTMVYGPIAALLVELFPTRIRYTGMSLPYHIGNGWFGGFLPPTAFAIVAASGNIFAGLWYPIVIAVMTLVIGFFFLPETKDRDIYKED